MAPPGASTAPRGHSPRLPAFTGEASWSSSRCTIPSSPHLAAQNSGVSPDLPARSGSARSSRRRLTASDRCRFAARQSAVLPSVSRPSNKPETSPDQLFAALDRKPTSPNEAAHMKDCWIAPGSGDRARSNNAKSLGLRAARQLGRAELPKSVAKSRRAVTVTTASNARHAPATQRASGAPHSRTDRDSTSSGKSSASSTAAAWRPVIGEQGCGEGEGERQPPMRMSC